MSLEVRIVANPYSGENRHLNRNEWVFKILFLDLDSGCTSRLYVKGYISSPLRLLIEI
jgi:hypothetical protein